MIFRTVDGKLININKIDFLNDVLYYEKIIKLKQLFLNNSLQKTPINT